MYCDNTTAVAYLRKQSGLRSEFLNGIAQRILRWAERLDVTLLPQFIAGKQNIVADTLYLRDQVLNAEWSLCPQMFRDLSLLWPVTIDLFAT